MVIEKVMLILALLYGSGCSGALLLGAQQRGLTLSQEELTAYQDAGMNVYGCINASGPPPMGSTTWIIMPKGTFTGANFGDGCHLR